LDSVLVYPKLGGGPWKTFNDVEFRIMPSGDGGWYWEVNRNAILAILSRVIPAAFS
jgi:hypothetical protein